MKYFRQDRLKMRYYLRQITGKILVSVLKYIWCLNVFFGRVLSMIETSKWMYEIKCRELTFLKLELYKYWVHEKKKTLVCVIV